MFDFVRIEALRIGGWRKHDEDLHQKEISTEVQRVTQEHGEVSDYSPV
jgi:hypothetical protein